MAKSTKVFQVRDKRANGRFFIDEELIRNYGKDIGPYGIAVYNVLAMYTNNETQECYPSVKTIADLLGISTPTTVKIIKNLEKYGLIHITHQGNNKCGIYNLPNIYTLLDIKGGIKEVNTPDNEIKGGIKEVNTGSKTDLDPGINDVTWNQTDNNQTDITNGASAAPQRQTPLIDVLETKYRDADSGHGKTGNPAKDKAGVIAEAFQETFKKPADIPRLMRMAYDLNSGWLLIQRILSCTGQKVHDDPHDYLQKAINRERNGQKQANNPVPASVIPPELQEKFNRKMARAERVGG